MNRVVATLGAADQGQRLELPGGSLIYRLERRATWKRVRLLVTAQADVVVRAPTRVSRRWVEGFIREQEAWLRQRLEQARDALARRPGLEEGRELPLLGEVVRLRLLSPQRGITRRVGNELWVTTADAVALAVENWYRRLAHHHLGERLAHWTRVMQPPQSPRLTIRGQKSRWGSCSSHGGISLNWRLLHLPPEVVDYVVIHELAHLFHPDHSPVFWACVARHDPCHHHHRQLLKHYHPPW